MKKTKEKAMESLSIELTKLNSEERVGLLTEAFDLLSCQELQVTRQRAEKKWQEKLEEAKSAAIEKMRTELALVGVDPSDISVSFEKQGRRRREGFGGQRQWPAIKPKYKGPKGETWSGRGYPPKWLKELESQGHNRQEYKIEESTAGGS
jgi:DNA-binding protein H-NS